MSKELQLPGRTATTTPSVPKVVSSAPSLKRHTASFGVPATFVAPEA